MSKTCVTCKFEPAWEEVGRDSGDYPQLEGVCRAPKAVCDDRRTITMDTEYMMPDWGRSHECQMWEPKT